MVAMEDDHNDIMPTARLFWMAQHFRIRATFQDRYELEGIDGYENFRTLPRHKVRDLKLSGDLVIEPVFFDFDGKPARPGSHMNLLASRKPSVVRRTMVAFTKAKMLDRAYKAGTTTLSETQPAPKSGRRRRVTGKLTVDVWFKQNEAAIQAACRPFYVLDPDAPVGHEKPRLGQLPLPSLGSVSTLKKDRAKIARKGFRITDLCPDVEGMTRGGRKLAPDMVAFVLPRIREVMLRPERMTLNLFRRYLGAALKKVPSMALRRAPSCGAIANLIKTLDDARVIMARFGEKEAVESRTIYTEGPEYNYPGELVLMDCWKIDLVARITDQGGWIFVSDPELKEWGVRRRLWVAIAMDACSRAILGMALGLSESTDLTRRALRMAITDKTLQCADAGCTGEPIPPIGMDGLVTDIGNAFKHPYFHVSALSLTDDVDIGPGDNPHLHGAMERFNRTEKDQALAFFTGTSFGDVITKGDYDAMGRASADVQTLGRGLWLHMSDVYNRSPHRGLDNQTPIDRFYERYSTRGAPDVYTEEAIRISMGLEFRLPVTREGVRFASNRYISGRLHSWFKEHGYAQNGKPRKLRVKVDPCDLGRISIFFDGEWHTLAGPARMRRVGLTDWLMTREALAKKHAAQAEAHAHVVAAALLKLERMGTAARLRSGVKDMSYDSKEVVDAVKRIKLRIKEDEVSMRQGAFLALDSANDEASFPATGDDLIDAIEAVDDPYVDAGAFVRDETDLGLDDVDIDQDGDPIDEVELEETYEPQVAPADPEPPVKSASGKRKPPAREPFGFLPQPSRKDNQ